MKHYLQIFPEFIRLLHSQEIISEVALGLFRRVRELSRVSASLTELSTQPNHAFKVNSRIYHCNYNEHQCCSMEILEKEKMIIQGFEPRTSCKILK